MAAVDATDPGTGVRIIFLGRPGVGKGTQAARLAAQLGIPKISTGDMLRDAIRNDTPLGREAAPLMDRGDLVPDRLLLRLIEERVNQADCRHGYILDGFPRTLPQAAGFEQMDGAGDERVVVIKIEVPMELILERLSGRRWCPGCQATYHVRTSPPQRDGVCDRCGRKLIQREDDKESVVKHRLHEYDERTRALPRYYENRGEIHRIDGARPADQVYAEIRRIVGSVRVAGHA